MGEDTKETVHGAGNEEILATLKFLQEEVRRLSNELQARGIEEDVAQLKIDVDINSQLIKDTQADVEENYMSIVQNKFDLEKKITDVLPVGSIIPWSGQTVSHANLPDGWQLCDGSIIFQGPMKDKHTPSLNLEGRFLRGGDAFQSWVYQDQMMGKHGHAVNDPGHKHIDAGHSHNIIDQCSNCEEDIYIAIYEGGRKNFAGKVILDGHANIQSSKTSITVTDATGSIPIGEEVRPKNMLVQYIIKIY